MMGTRAVKDNTMNIRTFSLTLTLITPCLVLAQPSPTPHPEEESITPFWQQPLKQPLKQPIVQSCSGGYIEKGTWIYRSEEGTHEWAQSLTPTPCGRYIDPSETGLMWYEIVQKFGQSPYWSNNRGMINHLICHVLNAREKNE
jgi:hypothetical protein